MREPLVNIVILTTNQFDFIGECIRSVLNANYKNVKLYLVDNNSDFDKYTKFRNKFKKLKHLKFIRSDYNAGFAGGCNIALKKIKSGYIVLLNDDTIVSKNWLDSIISYMEEHPEVGACQPKIKNMRKKEYFEYAGAGGGFMDVYGYPFCRGRIFYTIEKDKGQYDDITEVVWTSGNCLVTRASVLKKVGLLDEIFFIYGEEADLCWRMHYHGYKLMYIPKSVVYHYGSGTMGSSTPRKVFLHHRNGMLLLLKNYSFKNLLRYLPMRIFLDFVSFWYYLIDNKKPLHSLAVIQAYGNLLILSSQISERRRTAAFKNSKHETPYPLYKRSVILDYFLHKRKKFNQLSGEFF